MHYTLETEFWYSHQSCIFCFVPAGTGGKSRTGMQTGMRQPSIPPRIKFRGVSAGMGISAGLLFVGFFLKFFSLPLDFSDLSDSSSCQPALTSVVSRPDAAASSSFAASSSAVAASSFPVAALYPDVLFLLLFPFLYSSSRLPRLFCFFFIFFFFFTILFCVAFIPPSLQSNFFNFQNLPTTSLGVSHLQFTNDYLYHFVFSSCRSCQFVMRY